MEKKYLIIILLVAILIITPIIIIVIIVMKNNRECEYPDKFTVGQTIDRSAASGGKVHGQFGCKGSSPWEKESGYVKYNIYISEDTNHLYITIRYSKDSLSTTAIDIYLDNEKKPRKSFYPDNQGDWNSFTESSKINIGVINKGSHTIKFYTDGQQYGVVDLDKFTLSTI